MQQSYSFSENKSLDPPLGGQWLSGRVLDSRPRGPGFEPHWRHCVVVLGQRHICPSLVLAQPRKTHPYITERLWMGRKESNQTKNKKKLEHLCKLLKKLKMRTKIMLSELFLSGGPGPHHPRSSLGENFWIRACRRHIIPP